MGKGSSGKKGGRGSGGKQQGMKGRVKEEGAGEREKQKPGGWEKTEAVGGGQWGREWREWGQSVGARGRTGEERGGRARDCHA